MRDRTSRALKQSATIFLLVATLSISLFPPKAVEMPRTFLMEVVAVPAAPLHFISTHVANVLDFSFMSGRSRQDYDVTIKKLESELIYKDLQLNKARQMLASYQDFAAVPRPNPFFVWSGELQGYTQASDADVFSRSYLVSVGSNDGVEKDLPVVWGNVALGRINSVGLLYSSVRVLSDPKSRVCVRFASSRWEGVLAGNGRQICPVRFVPNRVPDGEIKVGDAVFTSGTDGMFPPDLVIGKVARFAKRPAEPEAEVEVELFMDLSRLESCLVLRRIKSGS